MVPWGEILECYNLDIWILVLDLKNELKLIFNGKQSYLGQIPENKVPCSWMVILAAVFRSFIKVHCHDLHPILRGNKYLFLLDIWGCSSPYLKYKTTVVEVLSSSPYRRNTFHERHAGQPKTSPSEIRLLIIREPVAALSLITLSP